MFDDVQNNNNNNEPKDIFEGVESVPQSPSENRLNQVPPSTTDLGLEDGDSTAKGSNVLTVIAIIIVVLVVSLLLVLGVLWYMQQNPAPIDTDTINTTLQNGVEDLNTQSDTISESVDDALDSIENNQNTSNTITESNDLNTDQTNQDSVNQTDTSLDNEFVFERNSVDTDQDGIIDQDEILQGTSPNNVDTDQDGLSDSQEKQYNTDPLNSDTDGDGYLDGAEVENGFDPAVGGGAKLSTTNSVN